MLSVQINLVLVQCQNYSTPMRPVKQVGISYVISQSTIPYFPDDYCKWGLTTDGK